MTIFGIILGSRNLNGSLPLFNLVDATACCQSFTSVVYSWGGGGGSLRVFSTENRTWFSFVGFLRKRTSSIKFGF